MAFLGRESEAERQRIERLGLWFRARSPWAVLSVPLGILGILDFFTMILGVALGVAAIVTGVVGLRDIRSRPALLGTRLARTGITLGCVALALTALFWAFVVRGGR